MDPLVRVERTPDMTYMTTAEVAEMLRVPIETCRYWRHVGKGPKSFKIPGGRRVLYAREDVEEFIAKARNEPTTARAI
jgi:excisionase family DNA binding protein